MSAKPAQNRSATPMGEGSVTSASTRDAEAPAAAPRGGDVALVCGLTEDGQGVEVIRKRGDHLETGTVRRLVPGKPLHGEVVRLRPRACSPLICDVDVEFTAPAPVEANLPETPSLAASSGPAQVATENYRRNWDAIYGRSRKPSLLN